MRCVADFTQLPCREFAGKPRAAGAAIWKPRRSGRSRHRCGSRAPGAMRQDDLAHFGEISRRAARRHVDDDAHLFGLHRVAGRRPAPSAWRAGTACRACLWDRAAPGRRSHISPQARTADGHAFAGGIGDLAAMHHAQAVGSGSGRVEGDAAVASGDCRGWDSRYCRRSARPHRSGRSARLPERGVIDAASRRAAGLRRWSLACRRRRTSRP